MAAESAEHPCPVHVGCNQILALPSRVLRQDQGEKRQRESYYCYRKKTSWNNLRDPEKQMDIQGDLLGFQILQYCTERVNRVKLLATFLKMQVFRIKLRTGNISLII